MPPPEALQDDAVARFERGGRFWRAAVVFDQRDPERETRDVQAIAFRMGTDRLVLEHVAQLEDAWPCRGRGIARSP